MHLGQVTGFLEHEHGEGDGVHVGQRLGEALVIANKAAAARGQGERTLNHPTSRQQNEAALGLRQLDPFKADAAGGRSSGGPFAGVALIHIGHPDAFARRFLDLLGKPLTASRSEASAAVTCSASRCPGVSTARWTLLPRLRLAPLYPARAAFGRAAKRAAIQAKPQVCAGMAAVGSGSRPPDTRSTARRSWASASNSAPRA